MLNSLFSVNGSTVVQAHSCAYGSTVTFVIQSLTGIETIAWSIVGTSKSTQSAPTISLSGTPSGATATVTMPSDPGDGLGRSFLMKLLVRNQREESVTYRVFGAANSAGIIPLCNGEELYRSSTHGWTDVINQCLNAIGGAAGSSGQLLYNNAGVIDGASGITIVDTEGAFAFGANYGGGGRLCVGHNMTVLSGAPNAGGTESLIRWGVVATDELTWGGSTSVAAQRWRIKTAGTYSWEIAGTPEFSMSATAFDYTTNYWTMSQATAPGNPSAGTIRVYVDSADGKLKSKNSAGTTTNLSA